MLLKLFGLYCLIGSSIAWLAPERCAQNGKTSRNTRAAVDDAITVTDVKEEAITVTDVKDVAAKQHKSLTETYKDHRFIGAPIRAVAVDSDYYFFPGKIRLQVPFNCTFHTYDPILITSVACLNGLSCKISFSVATLDTYSASEGYNWGAKVSAKWTIIEKVLEVGGEASTGGTYSCTYTKGRTTTALVECSDSSKESGQLELYNVKSDMLCDIGATVMETDYNRENNGLFYKLTEIEKTPFTSDEIEEIKASKQASLKREENAYCFMIDTMLISDYLLQKIKKEFPLYNEYTDFIEVSEHFIGVVYYKKDLLQEAVKEYSKMIPFTNESGNAVYKYACTKVLL